MEDFITAIGNFGFPIAITGYLLLRMEAKLDVLTNAIIDLKAEIAKKKEVAT